MGEFQKISRGKGITVDGLSVQAQKEIGDEQKSTTLNKRIKRLLNLSFRVSENTTERFRNNFSFSPGNIGRILYRLPDREIMRNR
jgi:hypothetical protein